MKYAIKHRRADRYVKSYRSHGPVSFGTLDEAIHFETMGSAVETIARRYRWIGERGFDWSFVDHELTIVGVCPVGYEEVEL